jgi:hypothetical protein
MRELYINDKLLELSDSTPIGISFSANNIGELQNRNSSFSNTIKVPITQNNKIALELSHLINSATKIPYRKLSATYIENGVEIVSNGTAVISSFENGYYNLSITSGNSDLNTLLGDTTVGQLYGDESITWTLNNVVNSNDKSKPYIYPLIDWISDNDSFLATNYNANINHMLPCLLHTSIFKKIESFIKYTFTGSYITSDAHLNGLLTPNEFTNKQPTTIVAKSTQNGLWKTFLSVPEGGLSVSMDVYPKINNLVDPFYTNAISMYYQPSTYKRGKLAFSSTVFLSWQSVSNYTWSQIRQTRGVYVSASIKDDLGNNYVTNVVLDVATKLNYNTEFVVNIETSINTFQPNRKYYIVLHVACEQHSNINSLINVGAKVNEHDVFMFTESEQIALNSKFRYSDIFTMKVKDFLKDTLNLRGLVIQTNSYLRTIKINTFDDIKNNKAIAKNWSDKLHSISELSYTFGNYAQKNWLRFKSLDSVTANLGDSYFEVANVNLAAEKTVVELGHPATEQKAKYLGLNIPKIKALDVNNEWQKPEYRILTLQQKNISIDYTDGVTTIKKTSSIPSCKFEGMDMLSNSYYKTIKEILTETKVINAVVKLNGKDIQELDFTIPILLDIPELSINNYFYINTISNYKKGLTNVELVRL